MSVPRLEFPPPGDPSKPSSDRRKKDKWRDDAACQDVDTGVFFPESEGGEDAAKAVCATCPVREPCLEFAFTTRQADGIWGGLAEDERRRIRRRNQTSAWKARQREARNKSTE